jgi:hypothetical protein
MNTIDCIYRRIRRAVLAQFGKPVAMPASDDDRLDVLPQKVLLVVYDPVVDQASGVTLSQKMHWQNVDELINGYIADIDESSGGLVKFQVVERIDRDEFPLKVGGFRYDVNTYFTQPKPPFADVGADYYQIISDLNLLTRIDNHEIDEVWIIAFPFAGFNESIMIGKCAFPCNSNPLGNTDQCSRRFVMMGFSYERYVGQMLEDFCHRAESILAYIYTPAKGEANLYARFVRYDKVKPGEAEVGSVHYAPNSDSDYDYGNPRYVTSRCDDWFNFPDFKNEIKQVNCDAWGSDETHPDDRWTRNHHKWWLNHLPRKVGRTNGIANNWWKYIVDPNRV